MSDLPPNADPEGATRTIATWFAEREQATVTSLADAFGHRLERLGRLERRDGRLCLAGRALEDAVADPADLVRAAGYGVCLYVGNRCTAAVTPAGEPATVSPGQFAPAALVDEVLRKGGVFDGEIDHGRYPVVAAGRPLRIEHSGSTPVAMVEVFRSLSRLSRLADDLAVHMADLLRPAPNEALGGVEVVPLLDDLSRRLQLLALNGNILAAQAGEHGKAFRVVFRELGNLAERSADARRRLAPMSPAHRSVAKFDVKSKP